MSRERFVFPLYGSRCSVREADGQGSTEAQQWPRRPHRLGALAPGLECMLPSMSDWHFLQPSEATDMSDVWDLDDHLPWICIVVGGGGMRRSAAAAAAEDVVRALRLYRAGWFLDPSLSETIHDNGGGRLTRAMGAYRMLYHDEDTQSSRPQPQDCLKLEVSDFADGSALHGIFAVLRQHRQAPAASAEMALEAFGRSYGCRLDVAQRVLLLSLAMEVLLGSRQAGREQAPLDKRLQAALALAGANDGGAIAHWFDTEARILRNAVAHGRKLNNQTHARAARQLSDLTRSVLMRYLVFSRHWSEGDPGISTLAGQAADCTPAFNCWLSRVASNGIGDEDKRWCGPPKVVVAESARLHPLQSIKRWFKAR